MGCSKSKVQNDMEEPEEEVDDEETANIKFKEILADDECRKLLMFECKQGFSEHHLVFWEEVQIFKKLDEADEDTVTTEATRMYNQFVKTGVKEQVNITEALRLEVKDDLQAPHVGMFAGAEQSVSDLIKGNFYYKFIARQSYKAWDAKKNAPPEVPGGKGDKGKGKKKKCLLM
jgi:hypothetical protein